ncbi:MAG: hypothetical protein KAQ96_13960, partial [Thermoplasmata archaeon]|nr:hypothetical protein [Thermoplasmata archaeon]
MGRSFISLLIVLMLALAPCVPAPGTTVDDTDRGPGPMSDGSPWTDSFDDMGSVYTPPGGLVGVEVTGGQVQLLPGHDEGWVASTKISCPEGLRYDLVVLETIIPGNSSVLVSILDPTKPPDSSA